MLKKILVQWVKAFVKSRIIDCTSIYTTCAFLWQYAEYLPQEPDKFQVTQKLQPEIQHIPTFQQKPVRRYWIYTIFVYLTSSQTSTNRLVISCLKTTTISWYHTFVQLIDRFNTMRHVAPSCCGRTFRTSSKFTQLPFPHDTFHQTLTTATSPHKVNSHQEVTWLRRREWPVWKLHWSFIDQVQQFSSFRSNFPKKTS